MDCITINVNLYHISNYIYHMLDETVFQCSVYDVKHTELLGNCENPKCNRRASVIVKGSLEDYRHFEVNCCSDCAHGLQEEAIVDNREVTR